MVDRDINNILKFGETLYPETRYSKSYLEQNKAVMKVLESGSKEYIHHWFGEKGGGIQYEFSQKISDLLEQGILRKVQN